jgi:thiamine pyrophosphate-dependent acetolactate synthase large subunit-like protein
MESTRVDTLEGFADAFQAACKRRGPFLIEFVIA